MARSVTDLREGLAIGKGNFAGFNAACTDDEIRELCMSLYRWPDVEIERQPGIVLARPKEKSNV